MRKRVALPIAILSGILLSSGFADAQNAQMAPGHAGDKEQDGPASAPRNSTATPAPPVPS